MAGFSVPWKGAFRHPGGVGKRLRIAVVSDIHYASSAEQACGTDYEVRVVKSSWRRLLLRQFRDWVWLRGPTTHNRLLDAFLAAAKECDFAVANGDFCCDTHFVGISHEAAFQSVSEVVDKLRATFGDRWRVTCGDHDLGKKSFAGGQGNMRIASWGRWHEELGFPAFWQVEFGHYLLIGVTSSLLALSVYAGDALEEELPAWEEARRRHLKEIRDAFEALKESQRVILFAHDPTALPFLWREPAVQRRVDQIEQTFVGHLHTPMVFWKARMLSGMPVIQWLGHTPTRWTRALNEARHWRPFKPRLCPSLTGVELMKDGGFYFMELDPAGQQPAQFLFRPIPR